MPFTSLGFRYYLSDLFTRLLMRRGSSLTMPIKGLIQAHKNTLIFMSILIINSTMDV